MRYPAQGSRSSPEPGTLATSKNRPSSMRRCVTSAYLSRSRDPFDNLRPFPLISSGGTGGRDAIERHLRHQPTKTSKAGIKRLRGVSRPQFRLRVGDMRVFYDVVGTEVHILAVVSKEQVESWLREVGE